jgi:hypothetical protein
VRFVEAVRGDLIVSIDPRRARGLRLVSEYRPNGHTRNSIVSGAFTDKNVPDEPTVLSCKGFRVTWNVDAAQATLRLPSRCLHDGDYGALRFAVLTERQADSDFTPDTGSGSDWIARG